MREDSFGVFDPAEAMLRGVLDAVVQPQSPDPDLQPDDIGPDRGDR